MVSVRARVAIADARIGRGADRSGQPELHGDLVGGALRVHVEREPERERLRTDERLELEQPAALERNARRGRARRGAVDADRHGEQQVGTPFRVPVSAPTLPVALPTESSRNVNAPTSSWRITRL